MDFNQSYSPHFIGWGMNSVEHDCHYLSGLLGIQLHEIGKDVKDSDYLSAHGTVYQFLALGSSGSESLAQEWFERSYQY